MALLGPNPLLLEIKSFSLVAASRGYPLVVVPGLLTAVRLINIVADQRPGGQQASVVEAQGL